MSTDAYLKYVLSQEKYKWDCVLYLVTQFAFLESTLYTHPKS